MKTIKQCKESIIDELKEVIKKELIDWACNGMPKCNYTDIIEAIIDKELKERITG